MELLRQAFVEDAFVLDLDANNVEEIAHGTLMRATELGLVREDQVDAVEASLLSREKVASTAIGHAVAVPHAYLEGIERPLVVFARLRRPLNLGAPDGITTRFVFMLLGPPGATAEHLDTLTAIARVMSDDEFRYDVGEAESREDLLDALERFRTRSGEFEDTEEPEQIPAGLRYSGTFGKGVVDDLRRRIPHYRSDFVDGLNSKSLAATSFLFFACLAPTITFGGLMSEKTGGAIGASEALVGSAICGLIFSVTAGTPLAIIGATGPMLVLTGILYAMCVQYAESVGIADVQAFFLGTYFWVGLWAGVYLVVLGLTEASCLMRFFTRFTDETFTALISLIYIYEAVKALIREFDTVHSSPDGAPYHATALLSLLLALGTFYIAMNLSRFRNGKYLRSQMREFLSDFGPTIAIVTMTLIAVWLGRVSDSWVDHIELRPLEAPEEFDTTSGRPWLVDPWACPVWIRWASALPAIVVAILLFMNQNITSRVVNSPDHKLHKGESYHWDMVVMGVFCAACSIFGIPWLVAAIVRSLSHVRSLATTEKVVSRSNDTRERVIHTQETRVTGVAIHVLFLLSLLALPMLRYVPMAVLYGVFLFMGVVSMSGNQFFERLSLWPMDPKAYPSTHYVRKVPVNVLHRFTFIQLVCLLGLWAIQLSPLGIVFPIFVALLGPVRLGLGRYFEPQELAVLDAAEEPDEERTHWK